jgi:hypothetical protein
MLSHNKELSERLTYIGQRRHKNIAVSALAKMKTRTL